MALTAEERREVNRKNSSRSTGPRSPEGKRRASLNAMTHGLRAEALALPNEDAEELRQMTDDWLDYHQPRSPGDRAAVDLCVYSRLQVLRCARSQAAVVAEQVRKAALEWEWACDDELERLKTLLATEPPEAARKLRRSALGCRWMLSEWAELAAALEKWGTWANSQRDRAIRLMGYRPEVKHMPENETAYLIRFFTLFTLEEPAEAAIGFVLDPRNRPDTLREGDDGPWTPTPAEGREALRAVIAEETGKLVALEARLRVEIEGPSRAGAVDRASLLRGPDGVLLARYVRMHDSMYNRAYRTLTRGEKKEGAEEEGSACAASSGFDPFAEVEVLDLSVGRAGAPNEANAEGPIGASATSKKVDFAGLGGHGQSIRDVPGRTDGVPVVKSDLGGEGTPSPRGS